MLIKPKGAEAFITEYLAAEMAHINWARLGGGGGGGGVQAA